MLHKGRKKILFRQIFKRIKIKYIVQGEPDKKVKANAQNL